MRLVNFLRDIAWLAVFAVLAIVGGLLAILLGAELLGIFLGIVAVALSVLATGG